MAEKKRAASVDATDIDKSKKPRIQAASRGRAPRNKAAPAQEVASTDEDGRAARVDCPRDREAEKQRFCAILKEAGSAYIYSKRTYIKIAHAGGDSSAHLITAIDTRAWAFAQYANSHKEAARPLLESYKAACDEVHSSLLVASDVKTDAGDSEDWEAKVSLIRERALFTLSSELHSDYAYVPYMRDTPDLSREITGIWRLAGKRSMRLVPAYIEVERTAVPLATSKGRDVHYTLRCVNALGVEKVFSDVPREEIEDKGLDAKFVSYAAWPTIPIKRFYLLEAISLLAGLPSVKRQEEADSLGWQTSNEYGLVWQCNNGIETRANGFILSHDAPFLHPTINTPGNGYTGTGDIPAPDNDIWHAVLDVLNTSNNPRIYGKLGAWLRVKLPPGSIEHEPIDRAGKLPFPIETIGLPRHGKSSEDNIILSMDGIGFPYNRETFLQEKNTVLGRIGLQTKVRYCLYTDYDHKASETSKDFEKQHQARHNEITYYSDGSDGGTTSSRTQQMRSRGNPTGGILITGNHEHTPYSIANGETADELRVMTFVWPQGDRSNDDMSREINGRRVELYTWGVAVRKWIMERCAQDKEAFTLLVTQCYREATDVVISDFYDWAGCDLHRNQVIDCVAMGRLWGRFLQERYPDCYLLSWFELTEAVFIEDRLDRCQHVSKLDAGHKDEQNVTDFVLDTMRATMGASGLYLLSQKGALLAESNVSRPLTSYGYRLVNRNGETYDTGATHGGYYLKASNALAFIPDAFYRVLSSEAARKKVTLLPRPELFKQLVDAGIVTPTLKNGEYKRYDTCVKVNGNTLWLVVIPHDVLFPPAQLGDGESYVNEDGRDITHHEVSQDEAQKAQGDIAGKVIQFPGKHEPGAPAPAPAQSELVVNSNETGADNHEPYDPFSMEIEDIPEYEPVS